jgi:hypothetical protein
MGAALLAWLANPANEAMLIGLIENGITAGEKVYEAWQLKSLNDLLAAVKADSAALAADVKTMDSDIDARDKQLEADLDATKK